MNTIEQQAAAEIAADKPAAAPKGISEEAIKEKVAAGLDRDQAIQVLVNQALHDEAIAEESPAKSKKK